MNIFACISHVPDTTTKIQVGSNGKNIDPTGVTYILNTYDEFGLEAGLQLKEAYGGEVTAVCVGPEVVKETIRKALAMGADKGIHIVSDFDRDSFGVAKALADALRDRNADVIFCGRQSIDYDGWQVPGLMGEMLNLPSITVVSKLTIDAQGSIIAERDIEGGKEIISGKLPAILSTQKGLNEPRYPKLQSIMAAKKKPIETLTPAEYTNRVVVKQMLKPQIKQAGRILGTDSSAVNELVRLLHEEAKVI